MLADRPALGGCALSAPPAVAQAARALYDALGHAGFSALIEWERLHESEREAFVEVIEALLGGDWQIILKARAELECQPEGE
jgi:hypothetical protein